MKLLLAKGELQLQIWILTDEDGNNVADMSLGDQGIFSTKATLTKVYPKNTNVTAMIAYAKKYLGTRMNSAAIDIQTQLSTVPISRNGYTVIHLVCNYLKTLAVRRNISNNSVRIVMRIGIKQALVICSISLVTAAQKNPITPMLYAIRRPLRIVVFT